MSQSIPKIVVALALLVPVAAWAETEPDVALEKARKAFEDGKRLHGEGKLLEAIESFKEAYSHSRKPVLLYNIGLTLEDAGSLDLALVYYRKFLTDAPHDDPQRAHANDRAAAITKSLTAELRAKPSPAIKIKPAGTYGPTDFQHEVVEEAPPGSPLDLTASVPEDSGFVVTLFFRGADEATFSSNAMVRRQQELVGRIPAATLAGSSVQYFLEVKDPAGTLITRSGKSTSPNLITIAAGARPRFYPDSPAPSATVDGEPRVSPRAFHSKSAPPHAGVEPDRFSDVGSRRFGYAKWGTTVTAGVGLGLGITFAILARQKASALVTDAAGCGDAPPPCRTFDPYNVDLQNAGKRDQLIANIAFGVGIGAGLVAGYFWYKERAAPKRQDPKEATAWLIAPTVGQASVGASAGTRF